MAQQRMLLFLSLSFFFFFFFLITLSLSLLIVSVHLQPYSVQTWKEISASTAQAKRRERAPDTT